jgi:hypothetical protein
MGAISFAFIGCRAAGGVEPPPVQSSVVTVLPVSTAAAVAPPPSATASASAAPGAVCSAMEFWDGERCLLKKEELEGKVLENIGDILPRCRGGDDQACPLALMMLQHDCDLNDARACEAKKSFRQRWLSSRTREWATDRCALGQYAACRLLGEKLLDSCLKDTASDCVALAKLYDAYPDLESAVDASKTGLSQRACELGDQAQCPQFIGGLGLSSGKKK